MSIRCIFTISVLFLLFGCKTISSKIRSAESVCAPIDPSARQVAESSLAKGHTIDDLIESFNANAPKKNSEAFTKNINDIKQGMKNCVENAPTPIGIEGLEGTKVCSVKIVENKSIIEKMKQGLQTLFYFPFNRNLKVKFRKTKGNLEEFKIFVKRTGQLPDEDPSQARVGGVKRDFENKYHWFFREQAGDLHPAFLWSALTNGKMTSLKNQAVQTVKFQDVYELCKNFMGDLEKGGFLKVDIGKTPADVSRLSKVEPTRIEELKNSAEIKRLVEKNFGKENQERVHSELVKLLEKRRNPIIQNREITSADFEAMGLETPSVYIGWERGYLFPSPFVQLLDHHRITAAYDLGMAAEVEPSLTKTFN